MNRRFGRPRRRHVLAYLAVGAIVFVIFLIASFPYSATISSMLAPYKLKLTYDRQQIRPPIGVELINVSLTPAGANSPDPLLRSPEVTLTPTLAALLFGRPGLSLRASLYDGLVKTTLWQRRGVVDLDFHLDSINPAQCVPLRSLGAIVDGRVSAVGTARIASPDLPDDSGQMTLDARQVVVTVINGIGFPPVELGKVTGELQLNHGTLALEHIHAEGGDADIEAQGSIQLGATLADSVIDLQFTLVPTPAGRQHLGFFLNILPHRQDPSAPYILSGPLLAPNLS
ncbi:MAG TPA: type II secretion system protein GspN [Candidatus Binataceae bacterium]|nr:type II secretion system protein GspN [Candidatus Binataceae bacterium]